MTSRRALIVGVGGQDGSYLTEILLARGYRVFGLVRHSVTQVPERIAHVADRVTLLRGDMVDQLSLIAAIQEAEPDEVYNFAGTSFVPESWDQPALTADYTGMGVVRLLEAIRLAGRGIRFYQASTSEMFGRPTAAPQSEATPFDPKNPYAVSKLYGHLMIERYRERFGLFAVSGILYNHESPRRGLEFVTRKITHGAAAISLGLMQSLELGNLGARRDWGFAGDYAKAMWLMLQQPAPSSYVIATGAAHSVQELLEIAFEHVGLDWRAHVAVDSSLLRPDEGDVLLVGDSTRAREELGWEPSIGFDELVRLMVDADLARLDPDRTYDPSLDWPRTQVPL
jgi:GDPmannose 4,6-dehydratase